MKSGPTLGLFSIKGFENDKPTKKSFKSDESTQSKDKYIPLIIKRSLGSSYNYQSIPSRLVVLNDKMFGSNYPKPEIVFAQIDGEKIQIDKITIRTPFTTRTGAFPMGEGLIFLSDTLQPLD